jgi:multidrug efflux pump
MLANFFIGRPIFGWVIAIAITLAGLLAVQALPVEQYPTIAPPSVSINLVYPGADAATVESNVTTIIEEEMNGVEDLMYMSSTSTNGGASITVTFESGTDIDLAQVDVQNRLGQVEARLPEDVQRQGITVSEAGQNFMLIIALTSPDGTRSALDLGNYASTRVIDELRRVPGVGGVTLFGSEYAMRIWLDPQRLASFQMSASEALNAVREAEQPDHRRPDRPIALCGGAATQRHRGDAEPLFHAGRVCADHPADRCQRRHRSFGRRRPRRARREQLRHHHAAR